MQVNQVFLAAQRGANKPYIRLNISSAKCAENLDHFDEFSRKLIDSLEQTYSGAAGCASDFKVQIWRQFHVTRLTTLCDIWKQFLDALKCEVDPLVQQFVNQELYSSIIKSRCACHRTIAAKAVSMSTEEQNIVRYAASYVPFAFLKKHETFIQILCIFCGMS